jgi:hypothetical protein
MLKIIGSATATDEWAITFIHATISPTANAYATVYLATTPVAYLGSSVTVNYYPQVNMSFGPVGVLAGTTTTSTVYITTAGATATISYIVQGYKRI